MYDAGDGYYRPSAAYGIQVSGVGAGTVQGSKSIIVPETFGKDPNAPSPTYRTSYPYPTYPYPGRNGQADTDSDSDSEVSTAVIVVVVIVVLTLVVGLMYCLCRRSKSDEEKKKQAAQAAVNQVYTQGHYQTEVIRTGQATQYIVRPTGVPMAQVPGMNGPYQPNTAGQPHPAGVYPQMPGQPMHPMPQPAPIAISDAMTITPAANAVPPSQPGQDQLQHLQFSSHPRPNFVTSVGDNDQSNGQKQEVNSGNNSVASASPNVSLSASYNPGWEPQPWTPPTRPASNNVNSSTLTERSLPPLPSHEASPNLMQGSPGTVGSNNPYNNLGPT
ncbi:MAG: hypothetical protein J3Q66DRAFT_343552 [Benniella sp.]|nr:MAG: hypothetical protein J3Q66DRAFT_343552 [Benniella sp.]